MFKRVIVIVLDSLGIGVLPDAAKYEDFGGNIQGERYYYQIMRSGIMSHI